MNRNRKLALLLTMAVVLSVVAACTAAELNRIDPPIPQNANTQRTCWDGTTCPNDLECPNYAAPGTCGGYIFPAIVGARAPTWCDHIMQARSDEDCPSHAGRLEPIDAGVRGPSWRCTCARAVDAGIAP